MEEIKEKHKLWKVNISQKTGIQPPIGYNANPTKETSEETASVRTAQQQTAAKKELKQKKAWEMAKSPVGSIMMTAFMLWMSGSSVQIFSLMIIGYAIWNPIKAIMSVTTAFARFKDEGYSLLPQMIVYVFLQLVALGVAIYKCYGMGLVPSVDEWMKDPVTFRPVTELAGSSYTLL